jgi:hypothetical protein
MADFPVHDSIDVLDGETIYKTTEWWKAVVLYAGYSDTKIGVYLWQHTEEEWRRRQKFVVRSRDDWERDSGYIETYLSKLEVHGEERPAGTGKTSDTYHLLTDDESETKCGTLNTKYPNTGDIEEFMTTTQLCTLSSAAL